MKTIIVFLILGCCYCGPNVLGQTAKCKYPHRYVDDSTSLGETLRNDVYEVNNADVDGAVARNLVQNNPSRQTQFEREYTFTRSWTVIDVFDFITRVIIGVRPRLFIRIKKYQHTLLDPVIFNINKAYNCSENLSGCYFVLRRLSRSQMNPETDSSGITSHDYEIARRKKIKSNAKSQKEEVGDSSNIAPRPGRSQFKSFFIHVPRGGTEIAPPDYVNIDDKHFTYDDYQG